MIGQAVAPRKGIPVGKLIAITTGFLIGCASPAVAAPQQKSTVNTPQIGSQQAAPATTARKGATRKLTPEKVEGHSENIR